MSTAEQQRTLQQVVRLMRQTPILDGTPKAAVEKLASLGRPRVFRRGSYLFHQEDDADDVMFLFGGRVEISSLSPTGQRQWHTVLEPPQFMGELGVLGEMPRTATGLALEDTNVHVINGSAFTGFLTENPKASLGLLRALARQVQAYGALVDDLLFLDLRGRVAKRLLGLVSPSLEEPPDPGAIVPLVTHADLASLAGGSRENVTRILSEFQKRGIIDKAGRRYLLCDIKALQKLARI